MLRVIVLNIIFAFVIQGIVFSQKDVSFELTRDVIGEAQNTFIYFKNDHSFQRIDELSFAIQYDPEVLSFWIVVP